jgi:hypothetical protein
MNGDSKRRNFVVSQRQSSAIEEEVKRSGRKQTMNH